MSGWREGLERGGLVRELVHALGELETRPLLQSCSRILESKSQEYRSVLPSAAYALGRLRHVLRFLPSSACSSRRNSRSPAKPSGPWARLARRMPSARELAASLLDRFTGLEPGAEATRSRRSPSYASARTPRERPTPRAIDRALWEPAFRQEETSRRRAWGLRALDELATIAKTERGARIEAARSSSDTTPFDTWSRVTIIAYGRPPRPLSPPGACPSRRSVRYFSFALPELERGRRRSAARSGTRSARHLPAQCRHAPRRDRRRTSRFGRLQRRPHVSSPSRRRRRTNTTTLRHIS